MKTRSIGVIKINIKFTNLNPITIYLHQLGRIIDRIRRFRITTFILNTGVDGLQLRLNVTQQRPVRRVCRPTLLHQIPTLLFKVWQTFWSNS